MRSDSIALVTEEWKLIWNFRPGPGVPEYELFDRAADSLDQTNLAALHPERVAALARLIERWRESALAARLPADAETVEGLSAAELERLRALGYL